MRAGTVVVTGATGFVGTALIRALLARGDRPVRAAVRDLSPLLSAVEQFAVGSLDGRATLTESLAGADVVVHLAARVHIMRDTASDPLAEFRRTNVSGSTHLAAAAAAAGVRRFIYLSSIKVNGDGGIIYSESSPPAPTDPYGISKSEAECALKAVAAGTPMQLVIVRPPLVYGAGVKGNFRNLIDAVRRGIPLPLGAIHNRRSLIGLENLVNFISVCIDHPAAANQLFLVSDGEDLSTTALVQRLARAMGRSPRLIPVPMPLLSLAGTLLGRRKVVRRLLGSLQVDISKAQRVVGWVPPVSVDESLRQAAG